MREEASFNSNGLICKGWLYLPENTDTRKRLPAIVMAHGFSAVKEQGLQNFAEQFSNSGFVVLVFDYRYFGESDGKPRCQLHPLEMVEDYRNAITWVSNHANVDPDRIGIWGTSYSGGLVAFVGSIDKRAKAIVAQVPSIIGPDTRRKMNPAKWENVGDILLQDRISRYSTNEINYIKVVAPEGEPCVLPGQESYDAMMGMAEEAPNWRNEITLESLEKIREFDPENLIHMIAPRALLIIAAQDDNLIPIDALNRAFERASEPKEMSIYPIKHFEIYMGEWRIKAINAAIEWYKNHLQ